MRFKTESVNDFSKIRSEIIAEGQSEASKVNHTIRKASYSSGGLIELLK